MFLCGAFLSCVAIKCLSKCPYFKKLGCREEVVLGVTIDIELIFDSRIKSTCRKAGQILGVLLRMTSCLNQVKKTYI